MKSHDSTDEKYAKLQSHIIMSTTQKFTKRQQC